jgi:beta-glucosidase
MRSPGENGVALDDRLEADGSVHDPVRIDYLRGYLGAAARALAAGAPLRGYFVWSLLDNFEWALGRSQRFGLAYTDYATQRRYPKDGATWYGDLVRAHRQLTAAPAAP